MSATVDVVRDRVGLPEVLAAIEAHGDALASGDRLPTPCTAPAWTPAVPAVPGG